MKISDRPYSSFPISSGENKYISTTEESSVSEWVTCPHRLIYPQTFLTGVDNIVFEKDPIRNSIYRLGILLSTVYKKTRHSCNDNRGKLCTTGDSVCL